MFTIHKFPLTVTDEQTISLPRDARILTVDQQNGQLCLWALVDDQQPTKETHTLRIVGTGHPVNDAHELVHISTVVIESMNLVWHVFEKVS